jgi:hypothetical protein
VTYVLPVNTYVMRLATEADADDLRRLAALDEVRPLTGRILDRRDRRRRRRRSVAQDAPHDR